ncbi:MAG: alpha/beta fold hydrolase [Actinomycetota bacterium]
MRPEDLEPARLRIRHRSRFVDVWIAGDGPPVVLFHGWGLSGRPYRNALSALAGRGYRAIAPSLAVIDPPWTLPGLAEIAADLLSSVDAVPTAVVGHSFGGALAIHMAADFPELVSRLVLVNSLGVSPGRRALVRTVVPGRHWRVGMQRSTASALLLSATSGGGWTSLRGAARWVMSRSLEEEMARVRDAGIRSTVLWGEGDSLLPRRIGERAAELLAGTFQVVDRDGWPGRGKPDHDWPLRAPEFFAERIDDALRSLEPGDESPSIADRV